MREQVVIGYDIYEKVPKNEYDHDKYYDFVEDTNGVMYKTHYGHDSDGDWYIACYEDTRTEKYIDWVDVKFYYEQVGRVPYEIIDDFSWDEAVGLTLEKLNINGEKFYGFVKWSENKVYIIK